ncbi:hypothetical protein SAMN05421749_103292 [Acinetobacter marinus]|uniref:Uncharacterized protein n=1 Tax=Acinetobacter marinus TaxID=281375 RepID=A0A1G6JBB5_9GAMM|nr:hypothetical protein [Acinetobacter marinus]SDC15695.1 hypothetical protein SAMN05421749_103292 [Acinetobacter marinus]
MTDCRIASQAHQYQIQTFSPVKPENYTIAQEVKEWEAKGNKPTILSNTGEVYRRGRSKDVVAKEAKKRNKSTFFFGCPVHGETRFCTVRKKCVACSSVVESRGES